MKKQPHVAQLAAESDLVKLTREFEELRSQLADLDVQGQQLEQEDRDANADACQRQSKRQQIWRKRRVLDAQVTNVTELLRAIIIPNNACCGSTARLP